MDYSQLPHRERFAVQGTFLNSAYTHPMSIASAEAIAHYVSLRVGNAQAGICSMMDDRSDAKALFARLIHCDTDELAWIPSTMVGENLVVAGLGLAKNGGHVVTDAAHFEGSQYLYQQLQRRGVEVTVLPMVDNRISIAQFDAAIRVDTQLVALSLVSALTGFTHDLRAVCDLAHARGALVYADIIQAAGAVPLDVRESGVDFCACSTYKWLMGDFGIGLLYVRRDRLDRVASSQSGYRQLKQFATHFLPFEPVADQLFSFERSADTAGNFEVGTLGNAAVAALKVSLAYLLQTDVRNIQRHRAAMIERLQSALPAAGYRPLTPIDCGGPIVAFAVQDAMALRPKLDAAGVNIQLYPHRLRISPSVFNSMDDIELLVDVLTST